MGARFSGPIQIGPEAHPACCATDAGGKAAEAWCLPSSPFWHRGYVRTHLQLQLPYVPAWQVTGYETNASVTRRNIPENMTCSHDRSQRHFICLQPEWNSVQPSILSMLCFLQNSSQIPSFHFSVYIVYCKVLTKSPSAKQDPLPDCSDSILRYFYANRVLRMLFHQPLKFVLFFFYNSLSTWWKETNNLTDQGCEIFPESSMP